MCVTCEVDIVLTMSSVNVPEPVLGDDTVLDNPVWYSLTGAHRELAVIDHAAARYPGEVSPFHGRRAWRWTTGLGPTCGACRSRSRDRGGVRRSGGR